MGKKKRKSESSELEFLTWKVRRLERKLRKRSSSRSSSREITAEDVLDSPPRTDTDDNQSGQMKTIDINTDTIDTETIEIDPATVPPADTIGDIENNEPTEIPEIELLEILGVDPTETVKLGKDIHKELALRLEHIATNGLTREARKELNERYLIPANCQKIGAPLMNLEIKAAVTEVVTKRDKGIEARQKQRAVAISGLTDILNKELESKNKDNAKIKQIMDICRILCDIQHAESVTRRNFSIFSIKKELKEHLINTKIDKYLFGENLSETLKTAKAVTKSGTELKTKPPPKPKPMASVINNLNWKSPAPARKPPNPPRGRGAAPPPAPGPSSRPSRSTPRANSSKTSRYHSKQTHRH